MFKYLLLLLALPFLVNAQVLDSLDTYDHKEFEKQTLKVFSDSGMIQLQVISPNLIKVSFSKRSDLEKPETISHPDSVYVRITQNLENIYMQTDSLLIVISKLDFTIKFLNKEEQLYITNQSISFSNEGLNLKLFKNNDEVFYNSKRKKLKLKEYSLHKLNNVYSAKNYKLSFDKNSKGSLSFCNPSFLDMKFSNSTTFGYYFKSTGLF